MWDVQVEVYGDRETLTPVPGYMRSTLTSLGPCARPSSSSSSTREPVTYGSHVDRLLQRHGLTPVRSPEGRAATSADGVVSFCDWTHGHCRGADAARSASPCAFPVMSADSGAKRARLKQWKGGGLDGLGSTHYQGRGSATAYSTSTGGGRGRGDSSRMFLRQKSGATKGEREIMMGICQNRGDLPRSTRADCSHCLIHSHGLLSHHDAWSFGKPRYPPSLFPPVAFATRTAKSDARPPPARPGEATPGPDIGQASMVTASIDSCLMCVKPTSEGEDMRSARTQTMRNKTPATPPRNPVVRAKKKPEAKKPEAKKPEAKKPKPLPQTATPPPTPSAPPAPPKSPIIHGNRINMTKTKPKLLLNIHLPRVPSSSRPVDDLESEVQDDRLDRRTRTVETRAIAGEVA